MQQVGVLQFFLDSTVDNFLISPLKQVLVINNFYNLNSISTQ